MSNLCNNGRPRAIYVVHDRHNHSVGDLTIPYCSDDSTIIRSEQELLGIAVALGARRIPGWTDAETAVLQRIEPATPPRRVTTSVRRAIGAGADPLGEAFTRLRSPQTRRPLGATYTPSAIVAAMVEWAATEGHPERVIDPGAGSARFAVAAGLRFPHAAILAVEVDPFPAILARGHLAAAGLARRSRVIVGDYRRFHPGRIEGRTLYLGNPPYVRHHEITALWKTWLVKTAGVHGLTASQLSGLHVYFFLATATNGAPGDYGAFITSAEWLDVNYGALLRELVLDGLGGQAIHVVEPTAVPFNDAATTAAITCFHIGDQPRSLRLRRVKSVAELGKLERGRPISRERIANAPRWTPLTRAARTVPEGYVELGELCRVHRGAVTGSNANWIVDPEWSGLPGAVLFPSVTRARELFQAATKLSSADHLRRVVDLPPDLDLFTGEERKQIDRFLRSARRRGAASGYIARHRQAWWSIGLRRPAPILATYMARRPPVFVRNIIGARHINIAHGIYPREPMATPVLDQLAAFLCDSVTLDRGRMYAGGLTKFEPREMERLPVPNLAILTASDFAA